MNARNEVVIVWGSVLPPGSQSRTEYYTVLDPDDRDRALNEEIYFHTYEDAKQWAEGQGWTVVGPPPIA